jgi:hypothetical protein
MAGNRYTNKTFLILCAVTVLFTIAGCIKKQPATDNEVSIEASTGEGLAVETSEAPVIELGVGVGPVRFGMSKEEVIKHLGQPDKGIEELGQDTVKLDYISSRGLNFGLNPTVGVNYIKCYSKEYPGESNVTTFAERTKKGVAMGASSNQITDAYGEPDRTDSNGPFTILYYDDVRMRSEMIITNDKLVGIKMVGPM